MNWKWIILALGICFLGSCQEDKISERQLEADPDPNSPSAMINIPLDEHGMVDASKVAKIEFDSNVINFGTVKEGDVVEKEFPFTNTGPVALILFDAKSTCGCTVPEIPKDPIPPGGRGVLGVKFNTSAKTGNQSKTVTVTGNTFPAESKVILRGEVLPNPKY
ncbi:MAG: DUF1573 domain-containing protein [Saprospiraceae bacterium]|nr:DUF1573 domain-containing protein [Saprospiraceae bacterium]